MSKSPYVRPKITKFFEAGRLENYEVGSFWFGTLENYRMVEEEKSGIPVEPRFSDRREGTIEHAYKFQNNFIKRFKVGNVSISDLTIIGNDTGLTIGHRFNEFVFCASRGAYSRKQHLDIKDGAVCESGEQYNGNPKLTHFAEIDLYEFLAALVQAAPRNPLWSSKLSVSECLIHSQVKYGQTERPISVPSIYEEGENTVNAVDYFRTLFTKPSYFSPENEFRVVLRANAPNFLDGNPPGMKLMSKRLLRSIRKIGTLDGKI